jgi:hypothetical protein
MLSRQGFFLEWSTSVCPALSSQQWSDGVAIRWTAIKYIPQASDFCVIALGSWRELAKMAQAA